MSVDQGYMSTAVLTLLVEKYTRIGSQDRHDDSVLLDHYVDEKDSAFSSRCRWWYGWQKICCLPIPGSNDNDVRRLFFPA
jgi:hypothetical protein